MIVVGIGRCMIGCSGVVQHPAKAARLYVEATKLAGS